MLDSYTDQDESLYYQLKLNISKDEALRSIEDSYLTITSNEFKRRLKQGSRNKQSINKQSKFSE